MNSLRERYLKREIIIVLFFFALSCLNRFTLFGTAFLLLLYIPKQGVRGAIKVLLLIALRTPINGSIAVSVSSLGVVKWVLLIGVSFYIIFFHGDIDPNRLTKVKSVILSNIFFAVVVIMGAIINSSYPTTAIFKVMSYMIASSAVFIGMATLEDQNEIIDYSILSMLPVVVGSVIGLAFTRLNTVNGTLQGLVNHPNMLGILTALFVAFYITRKKKTGNGNFVILCVCFVIEFFSASRTGMLAVCFSSFIGIGAFFPKQKNWIRFLLVLFAVIIILLPYSSIGTAIQDFIYKGHSGDVLYSRSGQVELYTQKYLAHPLLGSGFNVPYYPNITDASLNMNLHVEPGNIIWGTLGDCGIIGSICFLIYLISIYFRTDNKNIEKKVLFFTPILVCMGEMVFFSVNNIAIILFVCMGCYLFSEPQRSVESLQ